MDRTQIQREAIIEWLKTKRGTIVLPTGFGKTFVGCTIAAKQLKLGKINSVLILTPTVFLIKQWKEEFAKWNYDIAGIDFMCIQSGCKLERDYDLLIIDEVHTSFSEIRQRVYYNINYKQLLGLTATSPDNYEEEIKKYCPVIYRKSIADALQIEAISDYKMYNLEVPLDRKDSAKYRIFNGNYIKALQELAKLKKRLPEYDDLNIFDLAKKFSIEKDNANPDITKWAKQYWSGMSLRKQLCYNSTSKKGVVLQILAKYPSKKWILFNKSIKYAESLAEMIDGSIIYHSKMKDDEREIALDKFSKSPKGILIAVDALNAGLNVPDASAAISISGVSTELTGYQQIGRIGRKHGNKIALFYNLYSKGTIEESWVRSRTKSLNPKWITDVGQT